jgi:putative aldouronate transport system permease protein
MLKKKSSVFAGVKKGGRRGLDDYIVAFVTYLVVTVFALLIIYPMLNILSVSMSSYTAYIKNPMMFLPSDFDFGAYRVTFRSKLLLNSYGNTIIITVLGTVLTLVMTVLYAYPLSRPQLRFRPFFNTLIIITMIFSGGIVPAFLLMRSLKLINTLAAQYLPSILGAYNCILMVNFFRTIPVELIEAAEVDGAQEPLILTRIILPLSKPILATIALFSSVGLWNNYFSAVIYTRTQDKWPVQLVLREMLLASSTAALQAGGNLAEMMANVPTNQLRYATLIIVMLPIMCVYPFLQKYFAGGVILGAVKG